MSPRLVGRTWGAWATALGTWGTLMAPGPPEVPICKLGGVLVDATGPAGAAKEAVVIMCEPENLE